MILRSRLLSRLDWIDHGFGTRTADLSQDEMASLDQIHSALVLVASSVGRAGRADALVTSKPGLPVSIRSADCYPILLADSRRRLVAAVHAGWRGTAARIVDSAIAHMRADPADIIAAIGPGIGYCCYEVGAEVRGQFGLDGKGMLALAEINREQLLHAGVPAGQIDVLGGCTRCEMHAGAAKFHSYRREGDEAGRMISYINLL